MKYDFAGWATKANMRCSDGLTIMNNAFADNDGETVPLVWNHEHSDSNNVLGHAMLQNRNEAHRYSEANNLKAKADHRVQMVEDVKHKQTEYGFKHTDWKGWASGNYQL